MTRPLSRPGTSSAWKWIAESSESQGEPDPRALADRERRKALGPRADLTGRLLGDPPPGRSALEKKLEAERRRLEQSSIEDLGGGIAGKRDEA